MKTYEEEYLALMAVADAPIFETSTFEIAHACLRILDHSMFALSMGRANYLITLSSS